MPFRDGLCADQLATDFCVSSFSADLSLISALSCEKCRIFVVHFTVVADEQERLLF